MHDAEKDEQIWSGRFEDDIENIMFIQAKAVQEIANQIRVQLGPEEREHFASALPVDAEAYNAYLKGVFHIERFNPEDIRIAATHFEQAVEIDPGFALGHWGLGKLCVFQAQIGLLTPEQAKHVLADAFERHADEAHPTGIISGLTLRVISTLSSKYSWILDF